MLTTVLCRVSPPYPCQSRALQTPLWALEIYFGLSEPLNPSRHVRVTQSHTRALKPHIWAFDAPPLILHIVPSI